MASFNADHLFTITDRCFYLFTNDFISILCILSSKTSEKKNFCHAKKFNIFSGKTLEVFCYNRIVESFVTQWRMSLIFLTWKLSSNWNRFWSTPIKYFSFSLAFVFLVGIFRWLQFNWKVFWALSTVKIAIIDVNSNVEVHTSVGKYFVNDQWSTVINNSNYHDYRN